MMAKVKVLGIGTKRFRADSDGYGMSPSRVRTDVWFLHNGRYESTPLDFVLRKLLGNMTEEKREALRNSQPAEIAVSSKKRDYNYGGLCTERIYWNICKADLEAWAKRALVLLLTPPVRVKVEYVQAPTLPKIESNSILGRNAEIQTSTFCLPLRPLPPARLLNRA